MKKKIKIAPSILAGDFARLGEEAKRAEEGGADLLHIDIMDGHFVPNLTLGPQAVDAIRRNTSLYMHVHLMLDNPESFIKQFADAGADNITFHIEASDDVDKVLQSIKKLNIDCGVSLRPDTEIEKTFPYFKTIDLLLIMTVFPGFGGQKFLLGSLEMIQKARSFADEKGIDLDIAVDGGIDLQTAKQVTRAGANVLIAGTSVFGNRDIKKAIEELRRNV